MKRSKRIVFHLFIVAFFLFACDLPNEPGPMPTPILDTDFEPGLNILGILRLDDRPGSSLIRVERAYETEEVREDFSPVVPDANVMVQNAEDSTEYLFTFTEDSVRGELYLSHEFVPGEGKRYLLTATAPGLPELTASTVVPVKPKIDTTSWVLSDQSLSFELLTSQDTDMYDVYLILSNQSIHKRIVYLEEHHVQLQFDFSHKDGTPLWIEVYGYDSNLAQYLTGSVTLKPQTYNEMVTTVEGGYGCFGSVSESTFHLPTR